MRFEQVLKIYWTKGIFYNSKLHSFDVTFRSIFTDTGSFNWALRNLLISRFELHILKKSTHYSIADFNKYIPMVLNILFSKTTNINGIDSELHRYNFLRLYLIRTTRGRCHALGKPSRGQRTWSNAWNAFKLNNTTREFISSYQKILQKEKKEVKKNFKKVEKKLRVKEKKKSVSREIKRVNFWF
jgi:hypothetical protein